MGLIFLFILLRIPSLFEPLTYGDEGIYQVIGMQLRAGHMLYTGLWDNKPPLLFFLYGLFNGNQFAARLTSMIFGSITILLFHLLAVHLFQKRSAITLSTVIFTLLIGLPVYEGNIANTENFMILPMTLAALLLLKNRPFASGFSIAIATLFKIVAMFDTAAFFLFLLFQKKAYSASRFVCGFLTPVILTIIYLLYLGVFEEFISTALVDNVGYVGYGNVFIIPQGLLIAKTLLLVSATGMLFFLRKKYSDSSLFISLWTGFSLFNTYFSQRPYLHYVLLLVPAFSLLCGLVLESQKKYKYHILLAVGVTSALIFSTFHMYGHTHLYYGNFLQYSLGLKSTDDYRLFFDRHAVRNYAIATYIRKHSRPEEKVFIWGNEPHLYVMSEKLPPGRYSVAYHMTRNSTAIEETKRVFAQWHPDVVIVIPVPQTLPVSLESYKEMTRIEDSIIYRRADSP